MFRLDLPISFFIYEQTLFKLSNIQLEQQIDFLRNPFFIHQLYEMSVLSLDNQAKQKLCISKAQL